MRFMSPQCIPIASVAEKKASSGLGKRMLCHTIHLLLERGQITQDTIISLEASGGKTDKSMVDECMRRYSEADIDVVLKQFSKEHVNECLNELVDEDKDENAHDSVFRAKATLMCSYNVNQKLVSYYSRYGLRSAPCKKKDRDIYMHMMQGTVHDIVQECAKPTRKSASVVHVHSDRFRLARLAQTIGRIADIARQSTRLAS